MNLAEGVAASRSLSPALSIPLPKNKTETKPRLEYLGQEFKALKCDYERVGGGRRSAQCLGRMLAGSRLGEQLVKSRSKVCQAVSTPHYAYAACRVIPVFDV